MSYLLRVILPDRPGMLGAVATALGEAGADIVSLDVVERGPEGAVDDLVVVLPPGGLADRLITCAQSVPGVVVESLRPYHGGEELHRDLELVDELAADPSAGLALLTDNLPGVFRAGWAVLLQEPHTGLAAPSGHGSAGLGGTGALPADVLHASAGAPAFEGVAIPWLPLAAARRIGPREPWLPRQWTALGTELAAAPVGSPARAVLVGRPGGPRFRASEVLRLTHLAGIAATVAAQEASV